MEKNKKKNLTKKEELLLHLLDFEHHKDDYLVSELVTEYGIQKVLSCSRSLITSILVECEEKRYIYRVKSNVDGKKYKQNAFFLTKKGRRHALKIKKMTVRQNNI